jgi:hypothetical protein
MRAKVPMYGPDYIAISERCGGTDRNCLLTATGD